MKYVHCVVKNIDTILAILYAPSKHRSDLNIAGINANAVQIIATEREKTRIYKSKLIENAIKPTHFRVTEIAFKLVRSVCPELMRSHDDLINLSIYAFGEYSLKHAYAFGFSIHTQHTLS